MASSYEQVRKKIQALQAEAEKLRKQEAGEVIDRIKEAIKHYGLTMADLFSGGTQQRASRPANRRQRTASAARYADGQGNEWGGRGPRPRWLRDALAAGKKLDDFQVGSSADDGADRPQRVQPTRKKRAAAPRYRDEAGHSWSGKGRRPGWFLEALATGKKPGDLAIK
jgi:DNA-binding protein H-NS